MVAGLSKCCLSRVDYIYIVWQTSNLQNFDLINTTCSRAQQYQLAGVGI